MTNGLFLNKGKLMLMSKEKFTKNTIYDVQQSSRNSNVYIISDYIYQSMRDHTDGSRLGLAEQRMCNFINSYLSLV